MELKLIHDTIDVNEVVFDGTAEQSIEVDCVLPDYCPNIFKILKCRMTPRLTGARIAGDEVHVDGVATIFVVYLCEETSELRSFCQKVPFTKVIPIQTTCEDASLTVEMECEYLNCRSINPRRLDIRGAVGIALRVCDRRRETVVSAAEGPGIQKKSKQVTMDGVCLQAFKPFTVREELELPNGNPSVGSVLYYSASARAEDIKVITNKVIVKGSALLRIAYCPLADDGGVETVEYDFPISQIIDLPGVDDGFSCKVDFTVASAELEPKTALDGDARAVSAELSFFCSCSCTASAQKELICDLYSTLCETTVSGKRIDLRRSFRHPVQTLLVQSSVDAPEEALASVYDIWCDIARLSARKEGNRFWLDGEFDVCAFCEGETGTPVAVDKRTEFHDELHLTPEFPEARLEISAQLKSLSYHLTGDHKIDLRAELAVCLAEVQPISQPVVTDFSLEGDAASFRDGQTAVTLYFAEEGESLWEIAKRYHTSVGAILEENDHEDEIMKQGRMLLIPLVD